MTDLEGKKHGEKHARFSILLVDDEQLILNAYGRCLRNQDLRTATSIEEAQAHLDSGFKPDVVITDYNLGGGTLGTEILKIIQERYPKALRILISGMAEKISQDECFDLAHDIIAKTSPRMKELLERLQRDKEG